MHILKVPKPFISIVAGDNKICGDRTFIWLLNYTNVKLECTNPLVELQFHYVHFHQAQLKYNTQDSM